MLLVCGRIMPFEFDNILMRLGNYINLIRDKKQNSHSAVSSIYEIINSYHYDYCSWHTYSENTVYKMLGYRDRIHRSSTLFYVCILYTNSYLYNLRYASQARTWSVFYVPSAMTSIAKVTNPCSFD